jgi:hypothetical protein
MVVAVVLTAEIFIPEGTNATGRVILQSLVHTASSAGIEPRVTQAYHGRSDWLVMWGIGADHRSSLRWQHIRAGGLVALWDIGFFKREKVRGFCKVSINDDYATRWLDKTEPDPSRWEAVDLKLRDDYNPDGHIVVAGIGPKQRMYMGLSAGSDCWEQQKIDEARRRFPGRRVVYRPKPNRTSPSLRCETDATSDISEVLRGAALVICMHSNVAVDAVLAGIPFESEDGVSTWLRGKPYTRETRQDFCRRIARWQYKAYEMAEAWQFLRSMSDR